MNLPCLTIVRGLPGSGKSTLAHEIAGKTGAIVVEPDALLVVCGQYLYSPERYRKAVMYCTEIVTMLGALGADCIYADVLPTCAEVRALVRNYKALLPPECAGICCTDIRSLEITEQEALERNRHNVRPEDIRRMAETWQDCQVWDLYEPPKQREQ
jgi:hypothetical protein